MAYLSLEVPVKRSILVSGSPVAMLLETASAKKYLLIPRIAQIPFFVNCLFGKYTLCGIEGVILTTKEKGLLPFRHVKRCYFLFLV